MPICFKLVACSMKLIKREDGEAVESYDAVLDFFKKAEKPVRAGDVVAATGLEKKEVDKAMTKLKKEFMIVSPKSCMWEIRKEG